MNTCGKELALIVSTAASLWRCEPTFIDLAMKLLSDHWDIREAFFSEAEARALDILQCSTRQDMIVSRASLLCWLGDLLIERDFMMLPSLISSSRWSFLCFFCQFSISTCNWCRKAEISSETCRARDSARSLVD